ncbi:MAG TPA: aminotransferase class I/II-fold pyridoxal phosphate-dependent enzyme [Amycolatopsis sp.]|nr:aminotransferase class I/II-fold pyridoxal phosphate-dependent enzyme [Amycolatopsis sp.]
MLRRFSESGEVRHSGQIVEALAEAIRTGELREGEAIPSVRTLAGSLGVSPGTVSLAYRQLRERGLIMTENRRRARVSAKPAIPRLVDPPLPPGVRDLRSVIPDGSLLPDIGKFLDAGLWRTVAQAAGTVADELAEVMTEQFAHDAVRGRLTVTHGTHDAIERLCTTLLRPGDTVAVEDPGSPALYCLLRTLGYHLVGVELDEQGILPESLRARLRDRCCAMVIMTPRAQNPTGAAVNGERAAQLSAVLRAHPGVVVVEDDHAWLVAGIPYRTVTPTPGRWAVVRSAAPVFGPDLRLAVMASDEDTAHRVQGRQLLGPGRVSHLNQRLVARLLNSPECLDSIAETAQEYTARRTRFVEQLHRHGIATLCCSGVTVAVPVPGESAMVAHLLNRGWAVRAGEFSRLSAGPYVRVTTATITPEESARLAEDIAAALGPPRNSGSLA